MKDVGELYGLVWKGKDDGATAGARDFLTICNGDIGVQKGGVHKERLPSGAHVLCTPAVDVGVGAIRIGGLLDAAEVALGDAASHPSVAQALWT